MKIAQQTNIGFKALYLNRDSLKQRFAEIERRSAEEEQRQLNQDLQVAITILPQARQRVANRLPLAINKAYESAAQNVGANNPYLEWDKQLLESSVPRGISNVADTVVRLDELGSPLTKEHYALNQSKRSGLTGTDLAQKLENDDLRESFGTIYSAKNGGDISSFLEGRDIYTRLQENGKI